MSKKRAARRSFTEWDRLVDEWREGGQTQSQFSQAKGINPKTFQGRVWQSLKRRGISLKDSADPCHYVEVSRPSSVVIPGRGECRITLSNTQIEFSSSSDAGWIGEILSRLGHGK